jgi:hypothetical protein
MCEGKNGQNNKTKNYTMKGDTLREVAEHDKKVVSDLIVAFLSLYVDPSRAIVDVYDNPFAKKYTIDFTQCGIARCGEGRVAFEEFAKKTIPKHLYDRVFMIQWTKNNDLILRVTQ